MLVYEDSGQNYTAIHKSIIKGFPKNWQIEHFEIKYPTRNKFIHKIVYKVKLFEFINCSINNFRLFNEILKFSNLDLILVIKGNSIFSYTLKKIKINFPKTILANFNPDDPYNQRSTSIEAFKSVPMYDSYYVWSMNLVKKMKMDGFSNSDFLPFSYDKDLIHPIDNVTKEFDISFIGNGDNDRIKFLDDLFLGSDMKINLFGHSWVKRDYAIIHPPVDGLEYLRTASKSKIVINILRNQNKNSINMRTFELPGMRVLMLHEYSEEAISFFKPDVDAIFFKNKEEFKSKVDFYLNNPSESAKIEYQGYKTVNQFNYSYKYWIQNKLISILDNK